MGLLFAQWGNALLVRYISTTSEKVFLDFSLDAPVLGFTAGITILTAILFGILPALRSTRVSLASAMKGGQAPESERHARLRPGKWIVAGQLALSLVLLVSAGLFLRSFAKLVTLDTGFDRNNVLMVNVGLEEPKMTPEQRLATFDEFERRLRGIPGVISIGRSFVTPISGMEWNETLHADYPAAPTGDAALVFLNAITPGYFQTLRTPLLAGRDFDSRDETGSQRVAIVNQTLARRFFGNQDPLGKIIRTDNAPGKPGPPIEIIGVSRDSKYESLREDTYATVFLPINRAVPSQEGSNILIRSAVRPSALARSAQEAIFGVSKAVSLEFALSPARWTTRWYRNVCWRCFPHSWRTRPAAGHDWALRYLQLSRGAKAGRIRPAHGTRSAAKLRPLAGDARRVATVLARGIAAGLVISVATVTLLQKLLFGLAARDVTTLSVAAMLLSIVVILAGYLPARRATKVDPMVALRYE